MKNKIIDLFSGVGGLSLGFENAGFDIALAIDHWDDSIKTFNHNRKDKVGTTKDVYDFTDQELKTLKKEVIGIVGGPPCQGFSMVGTRDHKDKRNSLYLEFVRFVQIIEPKFFVLENVKGLLTLKGGSFKQDIIKRFSDIGYNVTFKILRASDYGVPQNRDRVFFVGLKKSYFKDKFFEFPDVNKKIVTTEEALSDLLDVEEKSETQKYKKPPKSDYQKFIRENSSLIFNHEITNHSDQTVDIISKIPDGGNIKSISQDYYKIRNYNTAFKRMNSKKPSNTIDCGHRNYFHYCKNRIPTVRESARIQSFPDVFEFLGSKTSQYKQVGNAVPPLLAYAVAKKIKKMLL
ncbi:TPA: DNA (cytosine-5-)-methyltransferase [Candidatus Nomurabacteria bacterium]|nr:MAG: Cytosine-specific methyltransferase [Parcubacteria bacterium RAAC4_OD1_1]HCY26182.1 DNA (cytosine-5-)-methyltransferase [Candidatus Nomurabacteria bacterium]